MKNLWILLVATLGHCHSTEAQCNGDGWGFEWNNNCYYVSYTGEDSQLTWHEARDLCLDGGGELASINSVEEEQHILNAVASTGFSGYLWIGLNRIDDYGSDYIWSDGTTGSHRAYAEGEPKEEELKQCIYLNSQTTAECFERYEGRDAFNGLVDGPEDADGIDTFYFGYRDEDEIGLDWCEAECKNKAECQTYTYYSNIGSDSGRQDFMGHCLGKTDFDDTWDSYLWAYSGERIQCASARDDTSGLWFSSNCGLEFGVACKKPSGSDGANTLPTTPMEDSYCPDGYYNIGGGNKCYKVEVFDNDKEGGGGITWDEAVELCRAGPGLNPDLASIDSEEENSVIMSEIQGYVFGAWIGIHQDLSGIWIWTDNSNPSYVNWNSDSPESGLECTEMHANEYGGDEYIPGKWRSLGCQALRGYACQTFKDPDNPVDSPPSTTPHECMSGWTPYQHSCYKLEATQRTYDEARDHCRYLDSKSELASIHFGSENSWIHAMSSGQLPMWIGFKQENNEYVWTDNTVTTYTNWASDGIDGGDGCVQMTSSGQWKDVACGEYIASMCKIQTDDSVVLTTPASGDGVCPVEWKEWGNQCYYFNAEDSTNNWQQSIDECQYLAGRNYETSLVSIHSAAETSMLVEEMTRLEIDQPAAWIGLTHEPSAEWVWHDGSAVQYVFWAPNEPNGDPAKKMCSRMYVGHFPGSWDDIDCDQQHYYICKAQKIPAATSATVPPPGNQECPSEEWEKYGSDCFLFRPDDVKKFHEASTACTTASNLKGTLASIHSSAENWWIHSRLTEIAIEPIGQNYWIGAIKDGGVPEGHKYYWLDGTPYDYEYWSHGEPNDELGVENCVEMWQDTMEWNDHDCEVTRGYVCKILGETGVPDTTTATDDSGSGSSSSGSNGGLIAGIIILVLVLACAAGGIAFYIMKRRGTPYTGNTMGNGIIDRVSFDNPLNKDVSPTYDTLYDNNNYDARTSTGDSPAKSKVQDGVLYLGSDA